MPDDLDERRAAFGLAVRRIRVGRFLSQDTVERRGGLARNQVGAIERAEKDVQLTSLLRLSDGLGVPLSEIVRAYEDA
jgi:transcriptional regulator with XRE-family HTH domain